LAEITSAQLLGEAYFGVSWLFFMVEDLQLGFGLIILGEVSRKSAICLCEGILVINFVCFMLKIMKSLA
jgi:hypothetical protein